MNNHIRCPGSPRVVRGTRLIVIAAALLFVACDEKPAQPPSQQAVEHAQERADQAVRQTVEAEQRSDTHGGSVTSIGCATTPT